MTTVDPRWEKYATSREYKAGQYIFHQDDPANNFFIVAKGQVVITKEAPGGAPVPLGYRGPGEMFGEIAIIHESPRTASASAVENTKLHVLPRDEFWRLLGNEGEFQRTIMETLIERLLVADETRVNAELWERHLYERFSKLANENERMAEIMQLRVETMNFIVHDLRNPIGLATTALEMARMEPEYNELSDVARFLDMAAGGLQRMLHLVDSLLDVEKLDEGEKSLFLEAVNLKTLIDDVLTDQKSVAAMTEVELKADVSNDAPVVRVDRGRIERVLINLLDNAIKFSPVKSEITVGVKKKRKELEVSVSDDGPGVPQNQRHRIFDRFTQTEEGRKARRGFGLGLAYCRSAVEAHGGKIWVEDRKRGQGAKFIFTLPLSD